MQKQLDTKKIKKILHNINSPLTTILGYTSLLKKKHNPEWVETIKSETERITEMVSNLQKIFDEFDEIDESDKSESQISK